MSARKPHMAQRFAGTALGRGDGKLGENVGIMTTTPHLSEFPYFDNSLQEWMSSLGVDMRVYSEASIERIKVLSPDEVILSAEHARFYRSSSKVSP